MKNVTRNLCLRLAIVGWAYSLMGGLALAAPDSLETDLNSLALPANAAPVAVSSERLYSVQDRYSQLTNRSEISLGGSNNFTADAYVQSQEIDLSYRYYISNRWFLGASGAYVFNSLSSAGTRLVAEQHILPDMAYVKYRGDLMGGFNIFYGKFRATMDEVFYFDQYVALGPGVVNLDTGTAPAGVADVGFSFWFGRKISARLGVKDYIFNEQRTLTKGVVNNFLGHLDVGILL